MVEGTERMTILLAVSALLLDPLCQVAKSLDLHVPYAVPLDLTNLYYEVLLFGGQCKVWVHLAGGVWVLCSGAAG